MNDRTILICSLLRVFAAVSTAQQPSRRIDLNAVSGSPFPTFIVAPISFAEGDSQCPEDREMLRISGGTLRLIQSIPTNPRPTSNWHATIMPIDDETQQYRIETPDCRMDVAVREQVRRDGSWAQRPGGRMASHRPIDPIWLVTAS